jgi:hypothetical protein
LQLGTAAQGSEAVVICDVELLDCRFVKVIVAD